MAQNGTLHALFPTPLQWLEGLLPPSEAAELCRRMQGSTPVANSRSPVLAHTRLLAPGADAAIDGLAARLLPAIAAYGELLLGEPLRWSIKELWANVLQPGGHQSLHNHANSIVSGIVYLTPTEGATQTVFVKGIGGHDFKFTNQNRGTRTSAFNAERWIAPHAQAGDVALFPSYLLHEVPPSQGGVRVTVAFNAIPERLDAWGYRLGLSG
ncbi:MAG: putative 2OG-Fe(II) oxygenase [Burkholderiales bacterium]